MHTQKLSHALLTAIGNWLWRATVTLLLMILFCNLNVVLAQEKPKDATKVSKKLLKDKVSKFRPQKKIISSQVELFHSSNSPRKDTTVSAYLPFGKRAQSLQVQLIEGQMILEGDILLDNRNIARNKVQKGVVINGPSHNYRWKNGVIPYVLALNHPQKALIEEAIEMVNETTSLCITPRAFEKDFLEFIPDSGCASYIGRIGGRQKIYVSGSCKKGNIVHELFHAAGLFHEHTSPNRDKFVQILWNNILDGADGNFKLAEGGFAVNEYDYGSIMHYPAKAFGKFLNGVRQTTIQCKGNAADCVKMGQRIAPSNGDIEAINLMYRTAIGCSGKHEWKSLNGELKNEPRVISSNEGTLEVFGQAKDGSICHRQQTDSAWSKWKVINGKLELGVDVSPIALGNGDIALFAKGTGNALMHNFRVNQQWSGWQSLAIQVMGAPTVISRETGKIDVFRARDG